MGTLGSTIPAENNFPLCVVLVFFPPFWTDAVRNVAIVVSFQKRSKRFVVSRAVIGVSVGAPVRFFPIRVFLWHVNSKLLHLFDKVIFVVAQRTLEKVAGGVGKTLDTRFVKPLVTAGRPYVGLVIFHVWDVIVADSTLCVRQLVASLVRDLFQSVLVAKEGESSAVLK